MAKRSQRFGVRNFAGARSSEWVVAWHTNASDVYLATRSLGGSLKASLHASGCCHVRAPDHRNWLGTGSAPLFLDKWQIDVGSNSQFPFAVVIPESELRCGEWAKYPEKNTIWINVSEGSVIRVAVMLVRADGDLSADISAGGWSTIITDAPLPDGRRLLVTAAALPSAYLAERQADLAAIKATALGVVLRSSVPVGHSRMVVFAGSNEQGTRTFVEAAVLGKN